MLPFQITHTANYYTITLPLLTKKELSHEFQDSTSFEKQTLYISQWVLLGIFFFSRGSVME